MFSVRSLARPAAVAGACLALAVSAPAMAGVVVKSSGPSAGQYPIGKKLDDSASITLRAGDSVTVLANGGSREIKGPGTFRVAARGTSKRSTFAALTRQRSNARVTTGTTRSAGNKPTLWMVDVSKSSTMCVADSEALRLWRPAYATPATYQLTPGEASPAISVTFNEKEAVADWNLSALPVAEGATYWIRSPDGAAPSSVTFTILESVPESPEALADLLIAKGCESQLDLLTKTMM